MSEVSKESKKYTGNFLEDNFECLDAKTFKDESPLVAKIGFKLSVAPYIGIACGLIAIIVFFSVTGVIVGLAFIGISVLVLLKVKDYPVMDIRQKALVIYTSPSAQKVVRIPYEEIVEWEIENDSVSRVKIVTDKNLTILLNTFQLDKAWRQLYKIIPDKETSALLRKQVDEKKISVAEFVAKVFKINKK